MNAHTYWQKLRSIGWLDYLPEAQQAEVREQLEVNLAADSSCAHAALAQTAFEDDPPEDVLNGLAEISQGLFMPMNVVVNVRGGLATLSFKHGGKVYSSTIPDDGEWAGPYVIELANQVLAESKISQRFIELPDTADFACVVFIPPDIYLKAQKANLIPRKYRVDVCLVDRSEAMKVASLNKIPTRLPKVFMWNMTMEQFVELLQMMSGKPKIKLRSAFNDPSTRRNVFELPDDLIQDFAKLPKTTISEVAKKWMALSDGDKSYFDGCLDLLWDRIHRTCELAQATTSGTKTVLVFLKGV